MAREVGDLAAPGGEPGAAGASAAGPSAGAGESLVHFRNRAIGLLRRRWHVLTLATLAGQLSVFLVLLACLRALDVGAGPGDRGRGVRRLVARARCSARSRSRPAGSGSSSSA